ncbi:TetR family transcriptional regulator [Phyllobacterium phragmitis]|uniref:TetR family transcriptional regulator n=1 Tax=Phyllobacterium phragmitis TaxID=2670329 RepID=A0A2S9IPF3_9HYPH|nr:TetR/AcrR family transcriptional regulator [Phyllobacterium phragmitis]PRD42416.1 TetR family transcriptional regulator [Phyllobacterium phragmitis]
MSQTVQSKAVGAPAAVRRQPTQQRSRERVERMLGAASALIAEKGSDAMKMSEVAERAGVPIGSLYQFFPDKGAIIVTLAERYNALGRECIREGLADVKDMAGLERAFAGLVDTYYELFLAEPVMRDIWSGTQADKALRDSELADSRIIGGMLADVLMRLHPEDDREEIATTAFVIMSLGEATMRLAISVGRAEGQAIVNAYKRMVLREMLAI